MRVEPLADRARTCARGLGRVDGDAHELGAGARQRRDLRDGGLGVRGVGVGHRLHDDRRAAADGDVADLDLARAAARDRLAVHGVYSSVKRATSTLRVRREVDRLVVVASRCTSVGVADDHVERRRAADRPASRRRWLVCDSSDVAACVLDLDPRRRRVNVEHERARRAALALRGRLRLGAIGAGARPSARGRAARRSRLAPRRDRASAAARLRRGSGGGRDRRRRGIGRLRGAAPASAAASPARAARGRLRTCATRRRRRGLKSASTIAATPSEQHQRIASAPTPARTGCVDGARRSGRSGRLASARTMPGVGAAGAVGRAPRAPRRRRG